MSNDNWRAQQQHQGPHLQKQLRRASSAAQPAFMSTAQGYATPSAQAPHSAQMAQGVTPSTYPNPQPNYPSPQPSHPHAEPHYPQPQPNSPNPHPQTAPQVQRAAQQRSRPAFISTPTSVLVPSESESALLRGKLNVIQGEQRGEMWFLNRVKTSIGRALDNDLVLLDISSSRKHAQITRHDQGFTLLDLRSANGVYLNGRRVSEEELYDGDEIEIGETLMRFEMVGSARARIADEDDTSPGLDHTPQSSPHIRMRQNPPQIPPLPHQAGPQPRLTPPHQQMGHSSLLAVSASPHARQMNHQPSHLVQNTNAARVSPHTPQASRLNAQLQQPSQIVPIVPTDHSVPMVPQTASRAPAHHISASASYNPNITYGFGSQMSPSELNLSPEEQAYYQDRGGPQAPWGSAWRRSIDAWAYEMRFGRGRRALIIRSTSILGGLLCFFALGLLLSRAVSMWSEKLPIQNQNQPISTPQLSPNDLEQQKHLIRVAALVNQKLWAEALKYLKTHLGNPEHTTNLRVKSLHAQVESEMTRERIPDIQRAIRRGQLKKAIKDFNECYALLSKEGKIRINHIDYTLWLYQRELKRADRLNPPPTEQSQLERAARAQLQGEKRKARQILKRAQTTKKSRRALFKLRLEAASTIKDSLRRAELRYLLGQVNDTQVMLQKYNDAINRGMSQTNYKAIAPWIDGALRLAIGTPSVLLNLKKKKRQLEVSARKWLANARTLRRLKPRQARALLEAAAPYLTSAEAKEARRLLRSLSR